MRQDKILKQLTANYLSKPDVACWMAAADRYEELGDDAKAKMWRRRAELFPLMDVMPSDSLPESMTKNISIGDAHIYLWWGRNFVGLHVFRKNGIKFALDDTAGMSRRQIRMHLISWIDRLPVEG